MSEFKDKKEADAYKKLMELLDAGPNWYISKEITKKVNMHAAFVAAIMVEHQDNTPSLDGWFTIRLAQIEGISYLSNGRVRKCIKNLVEMGLFEVKNVGSKKQFKLDADLYNSLMGI